MSSSQPPAAGALPNWGKSALLVGLSFCASWGGSIVYWRMADRMPSAGELAFFLLGVPLIFCGGVWFSRRIGDTTPLATDKPTQSVAGSPVSKNLQAVSIVAAALRLPHGSSPDEVCASIKSTKARSNLDPTLRDADGFPVMTCRCSDADDLVLKEELTEWCTANSFDSVALAEEHFRALVLASQVVIELASQDLISWPMKIIAIAPHYWTTDQSRAAERWLQTVLTDRCGRAPQPCTVIPAASIDRPSFEIIAALRVDGDPDLTMVLTFESNISDATVRRWDDNRRLFRADNPSGLIPGEGAAGILVTTASDIAFGGGTSAEVAGIQEVDAPGGKRVTPSALADLMKKVLADAASDGNEIAMIAADTGHCASATLELLGAKNAALPHLDDVDDVLRLGMIAGSCGAVQSLAALIVAASDAINHQHAAMWISNTGVRQRAAAIVKGIAQTRT
jgi:hypothetical protein